MKELKDRIQTEIDTAFEAGHPFQHAAEVLAIKCGIHGTRHNPEPHIHAEIQKAFQKGQPLAQQIDRLNGRIKKAVVDAVETDFHEVLKI